MQNVECKNFDKKLKSDARAFLKKALKNKDKVKIKVLTPVVIKILGKEHTDKIIENLKNAKKKNKQIKASNRAAQGNKARATMIKPKPSAWASLEALQLSSLS